MRVPTTLHLPFASTLPEALLLVTIKVSLLLGIAALVVASLRKAPAATRHLVWTLALAGTIVLPLVAAFAPAWRVGLPMPKLMVRIAPTPATVASTDAPTASTSTSDATVATPVVSPVVRSTGKPTVVEPSSASVHSVSTPTPARRMSGAEVIALLWLAGVLALLARRMLSSVGLAILSRRARVVTDPAWIVPATRHAAALQIGRAVSLRMSSDVRVPMTWGTLAPTVLLPAAARGWSARRRRVVLIHELGHIRRRDTLSLLIAQIALAVHWYNPLVWVAARRMREEAERACDDLVLDAGLLPSSYADDLLEIAREAGSGDRLGAAALAMARRSELEGRLLAILDPLVPRRSTGRLAGGLAWIAACVAVLSLGTLSVVPQIDAAVTGDETSPQTPATPTRPAVPAVTPRPASGATVSPAPKTPAAPFVPFVSPTNLAPVTPVAAVPATPSAPAVPAVSSASALAWSKSNVGHGSGHSSSHSGVRSSWSVTQDDNGPTMWNGLWTGAGFSASFKGVGTFQFNQNFTDVQTMSAGSSLTVEEQTDDVRHRAEFHSKAGSIQRRYWEDGTEKPWDDEGRTWLAGFLVDTDRRTGAFVDQRYPRLMAAGGANKVLEELGEMSSDYGKGLYIKKLLATPLDDATLRRVIVVAGQTIESDHELAEALSGAAQRNALSNAATREAYLEALSNLESDYEHARVLMLLIERKDVSPELAGAALRSASHIESDYERHRLLTALALHDLAPQSQRDYVRTAVGMESEYYRGVALKALIDREGVRSDLLQPLLEASATFESDYEHANMLLAIARKLPPDAASRAAYRNAAEKMPDGYYRQQVMAALGETASR